MDTFEGPGAVFYGFRYWFWHWWQFPTSVTSQPATPPSPRHTRGALRRLGAGPRRVAAGPIVAPKNAVDDISLKAVGGQETAAGQLAWFQVLLSYLAAEPHADIS